jgi:hypothetical protein
MITMPGTPSNHANMYLMTYSLLPAPAWRSDVRLTP